jgi:hypothetical protein
MKVDPAHRGHGEQFWGNDPAKCHDDDDIRPESAEVTEELRVAERSGLEHIERIFRCRHGHRRRREPESAPAGLVGPRHDRRDLADREHRVE